MNYEASKIGTGLYQGSFPPGGDVLSKGGINALVLCAADNQHAENYEGLEVILAPGDDSVAWPINPNHLAQWDNAAKRVVELVKSGQNVLVTCMAGQNRSGLVVAIALATLSGAKGRQVVDYIRNCRVHALNNEAFERYILERFV
jgi:protein-tyrosine phosphatase